jgi:hypothetical protein
MISAKKGSKRSEAQKFSVEKLIFPESLSLSYLANFYDNLVTPEIISNHEYDCN